MGNQVVKPALLDKRAAAELIGVSVKTLNRWQAERVGPPRIVLAGKRSVRYRLAALEDWLARQETQPVALDRGRR